MLTVAQTTQSVKVKMFVCLFVCMCSMYVCIHHVPKPHGLRLSLIMLLYYDRFGMLSFVG